jgi:hypothetical protein
MTPSAGDTLVVAKRDGRALVFRLDGSGEWTPLRGGVDVSDPHTAWEIARTNFGIGGKTVWFRLDSESNSAIQPYQPN